MSLDRASAAPASIVSRLPRLLVIGVVALFIALLAYGLTTTGRDDSIDRLLGQKRSAPAPPFNLELLEPGTIPPALRRRVAPALEDGRISLNELRGTPVTLNLWASWCSPCRQEAPVLEKGWHRWGRRGVLFLGLDIQDLRDDARAFVRELGITYPTIREPEREVATSYGATGLPETYFISARGRVVGHVVGVVSEQQLASGVAAARAGRPLGKKEGGARRAPR